MRFNGVDLRTVHPALSINKEIPPGMPGREIVTVRGNRGETLAGYTEERDTYTARVNIAGKTREEAWRARALLAAWAASSGESTAPLEPTYWHGKAYDAILESISPPEFTRGFATVDVVFALPRPYAHDMKLSSAEGGGKARAVVGGTTRAIPVIRQTLVAQTNRLIWMLDGVPFIRLDGEMARGAVVEANFADGSLTVNGEHRESLINYTESTWQPDFTPGEHELASTDEGKIEARWRNEWI